MADKNSSCKLVAMAEILVFFFVSMATFAHAQNFTCPLNFTLLEELKSIGEEVKNSPFNSTSRCTSYGQALHFVLVEYVAESGFFFVPNASVAACWDAFDRKLSSLGAPVHVRSQCNWSTSSISGQSLTCNNISSVHDLQKIVPPPILSQISQECINASIDRVTTCSKCNVAVIPAAIQYLSASANSAAANGSISTCSDIMSMYAASTAPKNSRADVARCLFNIESLNKKQESVHANYIYGCVGAIVTLLLLLGLLFFLYMRHWQRKMAEKKLDLEVSKEKMAKSNSNLVWFTMDEIKAATSNFSKNNIVGSGGFGNVYKGTLPDGAQIAVKRFKNCSAAADDEFFHEVEVISSVKHRNLVPMRGCCVDKSDLAGHQRIIVYDYMPNGSLHDHLFAKKTTLDWPRRQNIALGIVRGLAYLHQEVQPAIIHRDIKANNILLDANWNARVADFGLAKFTPDGATHVTTRVAGTHGYVAPEYVMYGQLTEKSDVYSLGIVLLELFTGKKILSPVHDSQGNFLISDWAWSLVKQGRIVDALDPSMDNLGPPEVVERFLLLALLCSHPHLFCRPTIDQVLKIMENDQPMPLIPERPLAYTAGISDIEKAVGVSGSLSSGSGFQSFSSHGSLLR